MHLPIIGGILAFFVGVISVFTYVPHRPLVFPAPSNVISTPIPSLVPTSIPYQNQTPLIDCIGPDGKHLQITQEQCDSFNAAWGKGTTQTYPTYVPQNTQSNSGSNNNTSIYQDNRIWCQLNSGTYLLDPTTCQQNKQQDQANQQIYKQAQTNQAAYNTCANNALSNYQGDLSIANNLGTCTVAGCSSSVLDQRSAASNAALNKYNNAVAQCKNEYGVN